MKEYKVSIEEPDGETVSELRVWLSPEEAALIEGIGWCLYYASPEWTPTLSLQEVQL